MSVNFQNQFSSVFFDYFSGDSCKKIAWLPKVIYKRED